MCPTSHRAAFRGWSGRTSDGIAMIFFETTNWRISLECRLGEVEQLILGRDAGSKENASPRPEKLQAGFAAPSRRSPCNPCPIAPLRSPATGRAEDRSSPHMSFLEESIGTDGVRPRSQEASDPTPRKFAVTSKAATALRFTASKFVNRASLSPAASFAHFATSSRKKPTEPVQMRLSQFRQFVRRFRHVVPHRRQQLFDALIRADQRRKRSSGGAKLRFMMRSTACPGALT